MARSEKQTGFLNVALANYMRAFNVLENPVDHALGVYFHHCAIVMTCRQLAMAGRYLAFSGRLPGKSVSVVSTERARRISALMLTCGHYDGSGDFAFRVGLPGKSGVGGGILAVAPGNASIAVWSPGSTRTAIPCWAASSGASGEGHALVGVWGLSAEALPILAKASVWQANCGNRSRKRSRDARNSRSIRSEIS